MWFHDAYIEQYFKWTAKYMFIKCHCGSVRFEEYGDAVFVHFKF
jgi:hypothetical protein